MIKEIKVPGAFSVICLPTNKHSGEWLTLKFKMLQLDSDGLASLLSQAGSFKALEASSKAWLNDKS